ncbi:hypothetical protein Tco_1235031 [Tanacetum coccineum]
MHPIAVKTKKVLCRHYLILGAAIKDESRMPVLDHLHRLREHTLLVAPPSEGHPVTHIASLEETLKQAYKCEVSVDLFKCFFQACYVGDWVTFRRRGNKKSVFTEPMEVIKNWHSRFIFVSNNVIPVHYQPLVFAGYLHASHAFPNYFPVHLENDPDYQRLCRYPAKVRSYEDEVLFKADLAYMWEDYPRFPQILVDEQETAFKDFVYAWDATEAYYTGTEALVNDVGSPSHLVEEDTIAGRVKGENPPSVTIHTWLERFNKQNPHSFDNAAAPKDAENRISHLEEILMFGGYLTRLAVYKFEGDESAWGKTYEQTKKFR